MKSRVALVIGSGSVKCAAAVGLQNVLKREGIELDMIVGCSGGSMYAALMAAGYDAEAIADLSRRLWTREVTSQKNRKAIFQLLFPKLFGFDARFGFRDDTLVLKAFRTVYGSLTFESMKIPLFVTATDFATGEQVILSKGSLVDALRASMAIPLIFSPWPVDGRLLMDGFVSDPLPVGVAMKEGASIIVAMGFDSPVQAKIDSFARFAFQLSSVMTNNLLKANYAFHNLAHHTEVIPIIPEFKERVRLFDTDKIPYIIEEGERAAELQLPYLKRLLAAGEGAAAQA